MAQSILGCCVDICSKCIPYPLSPPINNDKEGVFKRNEAHRLWFAVRPRPEKCLAGRQYIVNLSSKLASSFQSNSINCSFAYPQYSKCSPTPNGQTTFLTLCCKAFMVW